VRKVVHTVESKDEITKTTKRGRGRKGYVLNTLPAPSNLHHHTDHTDLTNPEIRSFFVCPITFHIPPSTFPPSTFHLPSSIFHHLPPAAWNQNLNRFYSCHRNITHDNRNKMPKRKKLKNRSKIRVQQATLVRV
jgi:hypothetical protein